MYRRMPNFVKCGRTKIRCPPYRPRSGKPANHESVCNTFVIGGYAATKRFYNRYLLKNEFKEYRNFFPRNSNFIFMYIILFHNILCLFILVTFVRRSSADALKVRS